MVKDSVFFQIGEILLKIFSPTADKIEYFKRAHAKDIALVKA